MIRYKEFRPTGYDVPGLGVDDRQGWWVAPVAHNRDSRTLSEANWRAFLQACPEGDDVEIHRFGHWACGWFEIILVRPDSPAEREAQEIENALEDYPIIDDELYARMQYDEACIGWEKMSLRERIRYCQRAGESIFGARRDDQVPERVLDRLLEENS